MPKYLITFPNVFDHVKFKENTKKYFTNTSDATFTHYSRTYCEVVTKYNWQFLFGTLKQDFPNIKILGKQQLNHKTKYIKSKTTKISNISKMKNGLGI